jgi:hypothetical protein
VRVQPVDTLMMPKAWRIRFCDNATRTCGRTDILAGLGATFSPVLEGVESSWGWAGLL